MSLHTELVAFLRDTTHDGSHTPGRYHWMAYQQGQAAKTEAAEKALAAAAKPLDLDNG